MRDIEVGIDPDAAVLVVTSRQPTFPSEYAHREGNAIMIAVMGFVIPTLTDSLIDIISPQTSKGGIWLYLMSFGGILQIYAAAKDFHHGNTLTASIFFLFGVHWFCVGLLVGNLAILSSAYSYDSQAPDQNYLAESCYYVSLTSFVLILTICSYINPHGSFLMMSIMLLISLKLVILTINIWISNDMLKRIGGFIGVVISIVSSYCFVAEAIAENGQIIPTGKFNCTKTRLEVKDEMINSRKNR